MGCSFADVDALKGLKRDAEESQASGYLQLWFKHESWMAEPYSNWLNILPDIFFVVLLLRMAHQEVKELLPAIAGGLDGIRDYFQFWNIVDWPLGSRF